MENLDQYRREFLKFSLLSSTTFGLLFPKLAAAQSFLSTETTTDNYPIQKVAASRSSSADFNGDNIDRPHDILWNIDGYVAKKGGWPQPSAKTKVIVVGGGMSGLLSAYHLKPYKPLILEQDKFLGGNSKGEVYNKSMYSIGAAYITIPDEGTSIEKFLKDVEVAEHGKIETDEEVNYLFKNELIKDFWHGSTDPKRADEFKAVADELKRICDEEYPDIPWTSETAMSQSEWSRLDQMSFMDWLKEKWPNTHPHILEYFQIYAWSSFDGSIDELSALQMLNFVAAETTGIIAFPGGNALIAYKIQKHLESLKCPIESGAFVVRVEKKSDSVIVTYETAGGLLKAIECEYCVMAAPKFVALRVIPQLPAEQNKLMDAIPYRGYVVANVILKTVKPAIGFDVFTMQGSMPPPPSPMKPPQRGFTDVCFGTWAQNDKVDESVLTLYKPLPFDGARQFLFNPGAHDKNVRQVMPDLENFLNKLNLSMNDVKGIRMTRWGHSLPVAQKNLLASGYLERMCTPVEGRIYFANQDNFANPAFESCFAAAEIAAASIIEKLS